MKSSALIATCAALTFSASASAQTNLGDLLNAGATKVLKSEYEKALPLTTRGRTPRGDDAYLEFYPGGKLSGQLIVKEGYKSRITGTWTMDAKGEQCIYESFPDFAGRAPDYTECGRFIYRLNGKLYRVRSDTDRNGDALPFAPK